MITQYQDEQFRIFTIDNFLTTDECDEYIKFIDNQRMNNTNHPFNLSAKFFNHKMINCELSNMFWQKIKNLLPNTVNLNNREWQYVNCSDYIMMAMYEDKTDFMLHTDTGSVYDRITKEQSKYTILIYLNDDYDGGETDFYTDDFKFTTSIKPVKGRALIFDIDLWHKGNIVTNGKKYWIGSELVCRQI